VSSKLSEAGARRASWPRAWQNASIDTPFKLMARLRGSEPGRAKMPSVRTLGRLGWASLLVSQSSDHPRGVTDTCWDSNLRMHTNCRGYGDYARPAGWIIRVFDSSAAPGESCEWSADGGAFAGTKSELDLYRAARSAGGQAPRSRAWQKAGQDCGEIRIFVPSDAGDPHKVHGSVNVVRKAADGTTTTIAVTASDFLVMGFADSFGSGEGNPELGATFAAARPVTNTYLPARRYDGSFPLERAQWTDRWCHRSVYSWQIRSALQLALLDRHRSVTVLPYGCSGAEVFSGLLYSYSGVEPDSSAPMPSGHSAQIGLAYQELCKSYQGRAVQEEPPWQNDAALTAAVGRGGQIDFSDARKKAVIDYVRKSLARCRATGPDQFLFKRDVDWLLLVIGINDIGFREWVTSAITNPTVNGFLGGFFPRKGDPQTELRLKRLQFRYDILREVLDKDLLPDAGLVKDSQSDGVILSNVVMPLYPRGLDDENGKLCGRGNEGMTAATFPDRGKVAASHQCQMSGLGVTSGLLSFVNTAGPVLAVRNPGDIAAIEAFRGDELNGGLKEFAASSAHRPGYTLITAPSDPGPDARFANRGFCASHDGDSHISGNEACLAFADFFTTPAPKCWSPPNTWNDPLSCSAESADSLHVARGSLPGGNPNWQGVWRPFGVEGLPASARYRFYPYAHRTRLYRTPNDVYMLINNRSPAVIDSSPPGILDLGGRVTSGAFHPTAEGHAIISTMTLQSVGSALGLPK
jgi:hypothetical protein